MRLRKGIPSHGRRNILVARFDAVKNANFSTSMPFIPPRMLQAQERRTLPNYYHIAQVSFTARAVKQSVANLLSGLDYVERLRAQSSINDETQINTETAAGV